MTIHKKKCVCGHLLDAEDAYQQGRADAIKEFVYMCRQSAMAFESGRLVCDMYDVDKIAKQMERIINDNNV